VSVAPPSPIALTPALGAMRAAGADVSLVLYREHPQLLAGVSVPTLVVARGSAHLGTPAVKGTPAWLLRAVRARVDQHFVRRLDVLLSARRGARGNSWRRARTNAGFRARVERADVLVALDRHAVYTVWQAHRRLNPRAKAVFGLDAAVRSVTQLATAGEVASR